MPLCPSLKSGLHRAICAVDLIRPKCGYACLHCVGMQASSVCELDGPAECTFTAHGASCSVGSAVPDSWFLAQPYRHGSRSEYWFSSWKRAPLIVFFFSLLRNLSTCSLMKRR